MMRRLIWLLLPLAAGCMVKAHFGADVRHASSRTSVSRTNPNDKADEDWLGFRYRVVEDCAALEAEHVTLMFHGLSRKERELFHFQGDTQAVQVAGNGSSTVSVTSTRNGDSVTFLSRYADGTNTLEFAGYSLRLVEAGRLVLAGNGKVAVGEEPTIIHFGSSR